jgi:hypothetical protein
MPVLVRAVAAPPLVALACGAGGQAFEALAGSRSARAGAARRRPACGRPAGASSSSPLAQLSLSRLARLLPPSTLDARETPAPADITGASLRPAKGIQIYSPRLPSSPPSSHPSRSARQQPPCRVITASLPSSQPRRPRPPCPSLRAPWRPRRFRCRPAALPLSSPAASTPPTTPPAPRPRPRAASR